MDESLDVQPFLSSQPVGTVAGATATTTAMRPSRYELCGIVHHLGSTASSGHYTADARREDADGSKIWVSYDDAMTYVAKKERLLRSERNQRTAYMVMYSMT